MSWLELAWKRLSKWFEGLDRQRRLEECHVVRIEVRQALKSIANFLEQRGTPNGGVARYWMASYVSTSRSRTKAIVKRMAIRNGWDFI
jgi:hypothetical protein